jgi:tetratricopeptide (TPR) repeat protein
MAASSSSSSAGSSPAERLKRASDELRAAIRDLETAADEQSQYELVRAHSMLGQAHDAIARYAGKDDVVSLRCLAMAYVADGRWPEAQATIDRTPEDPVMLEQQAEMYSRTGREEEALATWQRALDANPDSIGGHYMRAFLLERMGRRDDAISEWEAIVAWCGLRGYDDDVEWPERELARLRGE